MKRLRELRAKLAEAIKAGKVNDVAIAVLARRQKRQGRLTRLFHERAHGQEGHDPAAERSRRKSTWAQARRARENGHVELANRLQLTAQRQDAKAEFHHHKSAALIARIKERKRRKKEVQAAIKRVKADIAAIEAKMGPKAVGNVPDRATGGSDRDRVVFCADKALGSGWFYSQSGGWTTDYCWSRIPGDKRSDCSQFQTSVDHAAGVPSSSGSFDSGWTGSEVTTCHEIPLASLKPGDLVVYGPGSGHHVERYVGHGITIGHGSAPIDHGTVGMIAGARGFRPPGLD